MTESAATSVPAPESAAPLPSPGRLLRTARERAGLGTEDLAGQLKLAKGTLDALERDDFASLSEPVYIRGYYRKIAKLLTTVTEAELIGAYNARTNPSPTLAAQAMRRIPLAGGVAAGTSRQYRGQGVWFIVAGVLLAGFLFALAGHQSPERLKPEAPKPEPTEAPAPVTVPSAAVAPESAPAPAMPTPTPATTPPQQSAQPHVAPAPQAAKPAAMPAPAAPAPKAAAAPQPAPAVSAPAAKPTQIELQFSESSFIRVEDARGKTLAIGLVRGGEYQKLEGEPPYTVFIGNAKNVKVFYGSRPVDFSAHVNGQNDTARFTVP